MDAERWTKVRAVFEEATSLPEDERPAFLDAACGEDAELHAEIERMLAVDSKSPDFLERPAGLDESPLSSAAPQTVPRRVGPYEILRPIAAGGMGVVYEALQENPHRLVALKMLRAGFLSTSVARRFQYEAELLARLRHPGIAQIYDAGVHPDETGEDSPYFVMEFVEGSQDLLTHADEAGLGLRDRLELFIEVCDAIHYGHQQGVIHRDLKPANILVDPTGHPKVIDFGVARATDADVALNTFATRTGELIGTLRYMSPEQLSGDTGAIDTRSDVYALGFVLYELLCGGAPYDTDGKSMTEVARIIRDVTPRAPRSLNPTLPEDLGWVLLRALEKERERRYPSVSEMAADVGRFLDYQPVQAGPPSRIYRMRKFVLRNRIAVGALTLVAVALLSGTVVATNGLVQASDEAEKFRSINDVLIDVLVSVQTDRDGRDVKVADLLDRAAEEVGVRLAGRPEIEGALRHALAASYKSLGLNAEAEAQTRLALDLWEPVLEPDSPDRLEALKVMVAALLSQDNLQEATHWITEGLASATRLEETHPLVLTLRRNECEVLRKQGQHAEAATRLKHLHQLAVDARGENDSTTLDLLTSLVACLKLVGVDDEVEELSRRLLVARETVNGPNSYEALDRKLAVASVVAARGQFEEADKLYAEALNPMIVLKGEKHPRVLLALNERAVLHSNRGEYAAAAAILERVIEIRELRGESEHSETLTAKGNLAAARSGMGDPRSEQTLRETLETQRRIWGDENSKTVKLIFDLGVELTNQRRLDDAEPVVRECLELSRKVNGPDSEMTFDALHSMGYLHYARLDFEGARPYIREAWEGLRRTLGPGDQKTLRVAANYAVILGRLGETAEAIPVATELVAAQREQLAPDDPTLITIITNLAELYRRQDDLASAEGIFREALDLVLEHLDPDHVWVSKANNNLAECLMAQSKVEKALPLFEEALMASEFNTSVQRLEYSRYRQSYGQCLWKLERFEEAASEITISYEVMRGRLGAQDPNLRPVIEDLVELHEAWGKPEEASAWRAKLPSDEQDG